MGPFWTKIFHLTAEKNLNLLDIIVVYRNMQYQKKIMSISRENEFGDKNNLETSPKMALFWAKYFL